MPFQNYIYEYYSRIKSGEIIVGKWILAIYEIVVEGLQRGDFFFYAKKANKAIRFIENFCHHCEGREDLLKLELWQKACVSVIFGIVDADGLRVWREVFIVIARKNGKTLFASAVIAYMSYLDGEYGAKIYCLAPKLEQADKVFDGFYQMLKKNRSCRSWHKNAAPIFTLRKATQQSSRLLSTRRKATVLTRI